MDDTLATSARRAVLVTHGATPGAADELVGHPGSSGPPVPDAVPELPLQDELHLPAWLGYERDARESGAFEALRRRFVQLRFPVCEGISSHDAYRAATRRGAFAEADAFAPGLSLSDPQGVQLSVHETMAGRIPVVTITERRDFVAMVQAFTERNEPVPVPGSMGACMVSGLNNWDRIAVHRSDWERAHQDELFGEDWAEEFRRLSTHKELYQDRFILLSRGAYSGVAAEDVGLEIPDWLERSLVIRLEHECTHYFVFRLGGSVPHRVLDELIADFVGLVRAFGTYREDLALRFLGLERKACFRPGGRLECYRGSPPLSDGAFDVLSRVTATAIGALSILGRMLASDLATLDGLARAIVVLSRMSLEDLAGPEGPSRAEAAFRSPPASRSGVSR